MRPKKRDLNNMQKNGRKKPNSLGSARSIGAGLQARNLIFTDRRELRRIRPFRLEYMIRPRMPETPELDKTLRPMMAVKRKEGRKPELIMRPNDQMQTGQEPNYYKVWDEGRKQWSTRPVEPEELDRYRRENRIFVTPRVSF